MKIPTNKRAFIAAIKRHEARTLRRVAERLQRTHNGKTPVDHAMDLEVFAQAREDDAAFAEHVQGADAKALLERMLQDLDRRTMADLTPSETRLLSDLRQKNGADYLSGADVRIAKRLEATTGLVRVEDQGRLGPGGNADGERWFVTLTGQAALPIPASASDESPAPRLPPAEPRQLSLALPIRNLLDLASVSVRGMAERLGLRSHDAVSVALNGGSNIRLSTLLRYAKALGYTVEITVWKNG